MPPAINSCCYSRQRLFKWFSNEFLRSPYNVVIMKHMMKTSVHKGRQAGRQAGYIGCMHVDVWVKVSLLNGSINILQVHWINILIMLSCMHAYLYICGLSFLEIFFKLNHQRKRNSYAHTHRHMV